MNTASSTAEPEFIIYSFVKDETSKGSPVWQTHGFLKNEIEARRKADILFLSAKYTRIEVRRKMVDGETGQISDEAIKVLDSMPGRGLRVSLYLTAALACVIVAGFLAFVR